MFGRFYSGGSENAQTFKLISPNTLVVMSSEPHQPQYHLFSGDSAERREAAEKVMALLRAVPRTDFAKFEDFQYDSDNSSDIPDPFSEDECDQMEKAQRRKRLSKIESDLLLKSRFSTAHKNAEQLVRQQTSRMTTDNPCEENLLEVRLYHPVIIEPLRTAKEVDALCAESGLEVYLRQKEMELIEKNAKKKMKKRNPQLPQTID